MTVTHNRESFHRDILRDKVGSCYSEADALLWMVLLHTHEIRLKPGAAMTANGSPLLAFSALTQRHAAEVVAGLWSERNPEDGERCGYVYWYYQYNTRVPYEVLDMVPTDLLPRLNRIARRTGEGPARRRSCTGGLIPSSTNYDDPKQAGRASSPIRARFWNSEKDGWP